VQSRLFLSTNHVAPWVIPADRGDVRLVSIDDNDCEGFVGREGKYHSFFYD